MAIARRTPEQLIADLERQIATVKRRAAVQKVRKSPALRYVGVAIAAIDKALAVSENDDTRNSLGEVRSSLSACLSHNDALIPKRSGPPSRRRRGRSDVVDAAAPLAVYSFGAYERAALQRALGEAREGRLAAAQLLGKSKSAFYRRIRVHGVRSSRVPTPDDIGNDLPLDLIAYERRAISAALDAAGGDKQQAAKLIGESKSTFYRVASQHGI